MPNEIEKYLELCSNRVKDNVEIVTANELGQNYFLHVSPDKMDRKKYIPQISKRQADSEDRTIPRITVADTILGCLCGYASFFSDILFYDPGVEDCKQGLYIHEIEFDKCLKPNSKLVYDAKQSNEHWLVTYDKDTVEYKGKTIGKVFASSITIVVGQKDNTLASLYIEVIKEEGIKFSKNIFLTKGYWIVKCPIRSDCMAWDKDKLVIAMPVSKDEYLGNKKLSAAMLSMNFDKPSFTKW